MAISCRSLLPVVAVVGVVGLLMLNWQEQRRTNEKLDALTAALAERPQPAPAPPATPGFGATVPPAGAVPRELDKVSLPPYVIEAPDVLTIEAVVTDPRTGAVQAFPKQPVSGQFLVRPDGTVGLGAYGSVAVTGLTPEQASSAIGAHLAKFNPAEASPANLKVVVDVLAYNSKAYYVITNGGKDGEQVVRLPATGNETVLDAVAGVDGLPAVAGKGKVWITRKPPNGAEQTLPVDWTAITQHGVTTTNYQLLPSDRLYVRRAGD